MSPRELGKDDRGDALARTGRGDPRQDRRRGLGRRTAETGHYGASFESDYLDASLLQMVELRYLAPDDPRFVSTFEQVEKALRRGEHMLRYAQEDDFGAAGNCLQHLHLLADRRARALRPGRRGARAVRRPCSTTGPRSGLLSEDMDFETGELWGNFPQTYSLVGVINCAGLLSKSWNTIR